MKAKLMVVDDEPEVLNSLKRLLRAHFDLHLFLDAGEALEFLAHTHCHIIMSDMKMPKMNGCEFLTKAVAISPNSKTIVLTGHADIDEAKQVVNNAKISRYFTKPWKNKELLSELIELVNIYNEELLHKKKINLLVGSHSELSLAKQSMNHIIQDMLDDHLETNKRNERLSLINSEMIEFSVRLISLLLEDETGHNSRVAQQAKLIAQSMGLSKKEQKVIYLSGLYYSIGMISIPQHLRKLTIEKMTYSDRKQWMSFVQDSAKILTKIQLLKPTSHIIAHIFEHVDGSGLPDKLQNEEIPIGSKILALVIHYDRLLMGKVYQTPLSQEQAFSKLPPLIGKVFDSKVFVHLKKIFEQPGLKQFEYAINIEKLEENMVASQDIYNQNNQKLLAKNISITNVMIDSLMRYQENVGHPVIVYINSYKESEHEK
jgi:response regulator RpfG family c-di-GMP phosphodiesterase